MRWFVLGYVTNIWVTEGLRALGGWYDRRHRPARYDGDATP